MTRVRFPSFPPHKTPSECVRKGFFCICCSHAKSVGSPGTIAGGSNDLCACAEHPLLVAYPSAPCNIYRVLGLRREGAPVAVAHRASTGSSSVGALGPCIQQAPSLRPIHTNSVPPLFVAHLQPRPAVLRMWRYELGDCLLQSCNTGSMRQISLLKNP